MSPTPKFPGTPWAGPLGDACAPGCRRAASGPRAQVSMGVGRGWQVLCPLSPGGGGWWQAPVLGLSVHLPGGWEPCMVLTLLQLPALKTWFSLLTLDIAPSPFPLLVLRGAQRTELSLLLLYPHPAPSS